VQIGQGANWPGSYWPIRAWAWERKGCESCLSIHSCPPWRPSPDHLFIRPITFCITVAELRQMKSAESCPCRTDCRAHVVGTKVVIQPVCGHIHIPTVAGRHLHIRCDVLFGGLLELSRKWSSYWRVQPSAAACEHGGQSQKSSIARFQYSILADAVVIESDGRGSNIVNGV